MKNKHQDLIGRITQPIHVFKHVWYNSHSAPISRFTIPYVGVVSHNTGFYYCWFEWRGNDLIVDCVTDHFSDNCIFYYITKGNK